MLIKMYYPFFTKSFNVIIPLVPTMISVQYYLRSKIDNYDPDIYEPLN
jgi:hypothetical protein